MRQSLNYDKIQANFHLSRRNTALFTLYQLAEALRIWLSRLLALARKSLYGTVERRMAF